MPLTRERSRVIPQCLLIKLLTFSKFKKKIVGIKENSDPYDFNWFLAIVPPDTNALSKPTFEDDLHWKTPSLI